MRLVIVIVFLLAYNSIYSQDSTYLNYNKLIEIAKSKSELKDYESSIKYYDSAFSIINYIPYHYFDAFSLCILDNNFSKAYDYLMTGALKGLDVSIFNTDETQIFKETLYANKYNLIKDSLLAVHFNSIDTNYYQFLRELKERDQLVRDNSDEMYKNDSINFNQLIDIIAKKGFPTFETVGYGYNIAWLLLWHHRDEYPNSENWGKIISIIEKEIEKGKVDPRFFEMFDEAVANDIDKK